MNAILTRIGLAALLLSIPGVVFAAVITVNTATDPIDIDWQTATIADLPGPDGKVSFSEAMIAADNTPGHDTIEFAVPQDDGQMQWLYPECTVIYSSYTYFWRASESVTIDGTTQTAFGGDTNPNGADLVIYGSAISLGGGTSEFTGVHAGAVGLGGSDNLITGNTGGINISVYGGEGSVIRGNECGTIKLDRTSRNTVAGNVTQRVRVLGAPGLGTPTEGNVIGGPDPADRNFITGYGYVNSEGLPAGAAIQIASATGTVVENNSIGTTIDGLSQGNLACTMGVRLEGENFDTIIRNNRIAGILGRGMGPHHAGQLFGWAIFISGSGSGLTISGNTIGLNANDEPILGSVTGIDIGTWSYAGATNIEITDNVIAGNRFNGITVGPDVQQSRFARNSIYANDLLGIDLLPPTQQYGVTPNDPLDADTGGNNLQNFPVLETAISDGINTVVSGTLHSTPSSSFTLEVFASPACDASGHGEGQVPLGSGPVTTDASGDAGFELILSAGVASGWVVTATATSEPAGATSEFGACLPVTDAIVLASPDPSSGFIGLGRPWPNPSTTGVRVELSLAQAGPHRVSVIDVRGRTVATLLHGVAAAGTQVLRWDGRDSAGRTAPPGTYFVQLVGSRESTQRFILLR